MRAGLLLRNPVAATTESIRNGKALFGIYCTTCHGPRGRGDGPMVGTVMPSSDLHTARLHTQHDGYLYATIRSGGLVMPAYAHALSIEERWDVVNYVRAIQQELLTDEPRTSDTALRTRPENRPTRMSQPLAAQPDPPVALRAGRGSVALWLLAALGAGVFLAGVSGPHAQRAWLAYLVNWLFWSGLALSGLAFIAMLRLTKAEWAGPLQGTAEALAGFLPISLLLFGPLFLGREYLFSWMAHPVPAKAAWLDTPFLIARDVAGLIALYGVGFMLLRASRLEREHAAGRSPIGKSSSPSSMQPTVLSVLFLVLYAVVGSLLAFDLVMSLDPHWISTLFGAYVCIGNLYAGTGPAGGPRLAAIRPSPFRSGMA